MGTQRCARMGNGRLRRRRAEVDRMCAGGWTPVVRPVWAHRWVHAGRWAQMVVRGWYKLGGHFAGSAEALRRALEMACVGTGMGDLMGASVRASVRARWRLKGRLGGLFG